MNIANKTILITGASDGIGKSIALKLAAQQAQLVLLGRDHAKLDAVRQQCQAAQAQATTYAFDLTDDQTRQDTLANILDTHQIDVLINNAGIWHKSTSLAELSAGTIQSVITTNLTAQMLLTKDVISTMFGRESAIINIISSAGLQGRAGRTAYAASKYGMRGFTEALREETKDSTIRVGAVFQAGTNTQMFAKTGEDMPLQNYSDPDDLADVVTFMLTRPPKLWLNEVRVAY